jgi:hypothetical protein
MMCGGTGAIQPATEEIQDMVDGVSLYYMFYRQLEIFNTQFLFSLRVKFMPKLAESILN